MIVLPCELSLIYHVVYLCHLPSLQLERKGLNLPTSEAVSKKSKKLEASKNFEFKDEDIEHVCVCGVCAYVHACVRACACVCTVCMHCLSVMIVHVSVY